MRKSALRLCVTTGKELHVTVRKRSMRNFFAHKNYA